MFPAICGLCSKKEMTFLGDSWINNPRAIENQVLIIDKVNEWESQEDKMC